MQESVEETAIYALLAATLHLRFTRQFPIAPRPPATQPAAIARLPFRHIVSAIIIGRREVRRYQLAAGRCFRNMASSAPATHMRGDAVFHL